MPVSRHSASFIHEWIRNSGYQHLFQPDSAQTVTSGWPSNSLPKNSCRPGAVLRDRLSPLDADP
jgi:hypothetical protein